MTDLRPDSQRTCVLLDAVSKGDGAALDALLGRYRSDLVAFVVARLDPAVRRRLDPSDVVHEAQLEVVLRMDDFLERRPMPFHLWVRKTTCERLLHLHRAHRGSARRSVRREERLSEGSSLALAGPRKMSAAIMS
jgi:RNA polymerase sigma-70 factor (ECF subfamily)